MLELLKQAQLAMQSGDTSRALALANSALDQCESWEEVARVAAYVQKLVALREAEIQAAACPAYVDRPIITPDCLLAGGVA